MSFGRATLALQGPAGVVGQLRNAITHQLQQHAVLHLAALVQATEAQGRVAARHGAANVLADVLCTWPDDPELCGLAFCAAVHASGLGTEVAAPRLVDATLQCLEKHGHKDVRLSQAGLRLLRLHASARTHGAAQAPRVATLCNKLMKKHRDDDSVNYYAAWSLLLLLLQDKAAIVASNGSMGLATVHEKTLEAASRGDATSVTFQGRPWHAFVLATMFPRLRSQ